MKKILSILLILFILIGCSDKPKYEYQITSYDVDMSHYEGVNSVNHMFKRVVVEELFNCIENKSSGVFYLGRENCGCCQNTTKYLNEVAKELNVTIYYINVYDQDSPLVGEESEIVCDECKVRTEKLRESLASILEKDEDGKLMLQTPEVFSVINGKIYDHMLCMDSQRWDNPPTQKQIDKLKNNYERILKPFVK